MKEVEKEQQQDKEKEKQEVQGKDNESMEGFITLEQGVDEEEKEPSQEATLSVDEKSDSFYLRFLCNPLFWDMTVLCKVQ